MKININVEKQTDRKMSLHKNIKCAKIKFIYPGMVFVSRNHVLFQFIQLHCETLMSITSGNN